MGDEDRLGRLLRSAERQLAEAKRAYANAKHASRAGLPLDEEGHAQIVCRRHAERRAVRVRKGGRPACFDTDHPDCRGCLEDVRTGTIETWQ